MHQFAPFKKIFRGSMPPNTTSKRLAMPRAVSRFANATLPTPQKLDLPWQILHCNNYCLFHST